MKKRIYLTKDQLSILNCLLYNELLMREDKINFVANIHIREEILGEINLIKDMLEQIKSEE